MRFIAPVRKSGSPEVRKSTDTNLHSDVRAQWFRRLPFNNPSPFKLTSGLLLALAMTSPSFAAETVVTKLADDFDTAWTTSPWAPAKAQVAVVATTGGKGTHAAITFPGNGFQWWGMEPTAPLVIPGKAREIRIRVKGTAGFPIIVGLKDGWGRDKDAAGEFKWTINATGDWQEETLTVPADRVFPLSITGINSHNWSQQKAASSIDITLDSLHVVTDIADVDPKTGALKGWKADPGNDKSTEPRTPLVGVGLTSPAMSHVFAGAKPHFDVTLRSWLAGTADAKLTWAVRDWNGAQVDAGASDEKIVDLNFAAIDPKLPGFGTYALETVVTIGGEERFRDTIHFAGLPKPAEISEAEQAASPYGLNVHGGRHVLVEPYANAGLRWYRDYAFSLEWLNKSKGADRSYTGWPNHRSIVDAYIKRGLGLMPCMMHTIPRPAKGAAPGSMPKPDRAWKADLFETFSAFPEIRYWEIDNEYDLGGDNFAYEKQVDWEHYRTYHKAFAETLHFVDEKAVAVENGRAGIWPDLAESCIDSGDFANMGVINIHHYCGAEAPEVNIGNHNTNYADVFATRQRPALFMDRMRDTVRIADKDGKDRQVWITEFGWDDLAGPKIPTALKAAYLPRGYIAALEAGIDKAFWFFDLSGPAKTASTFFDGCGLLDDRQQPVPALASMAGLTNALPAPTFIGDLRIGEQIDGAVFTSRGKHVAALWTIDGSPASISIKAESYTDIFGNPLKAGALALSNNVVYAIGVAADEPLLRQVDYHLASHGYMEIAGGDEAVVTVDIRNSRSSAITGKLVPKFPAGWSTTAKLDYTVAPGASTSLEIPVKIRDDQPVGEVEMVFVATEGQDAVKDIRIRAYSVTPLAMQVASLEGEPGATSLTVKVLNQASKPIDGSLTLTLPASWKTPETTITFSALQSQEIRTIAVPLTWSIDIKPGETAQISGKTGTIPPITQPIIPSHRQLFAVEKITIDGDLSDWPASTKIDPWMLGIKGLSADADFYAGWRADGLAIAVDVRNSELRVPNPRTFWEGELLEVFIATGDNLTKRSWRADDHQFWITPLADEQRAYVGRWNHGEANPPTAYDLPGVISKVVKNDTGYRLEAIIPKALISGWNPKPGARYGIVMALTVYANDGKREVFWPRSKEDGTGYQPGLWGVWHLQ